MEYRVTFQKGTRVGARSVRISHVEAESQDAAITKAICEMTAIYGFGCGGYVFTGIKPVRNPVAYQ